MFKPIPYRLAGACLFAVMTICTVGCGGAPNVTGVVTYKGKPLTHGTVIFRPEDGGNGPQAVGDIGTNGEFKLTTGTDQPIQPGKYLVLIQCFEKVPVVADAMPKAPESLIPERFRQPEATPFRFEIKAGVNRCQFDLE